MTLTAAVGLLQVVEIDMRDSSDYRTMRLKLQMASSERRQQFSKEAVWRELSACDQTETLHHGESPSSNCAAHLPLRRIALRPCPTPAAAKNGAVHAVSRILASGFPADGELKPSGSFVSAVSASSPLYWAALHGHLGVARLLVLYGANPQWKDAGG